MLMMPVGRYRPATGVLSYFQGDWRSQPIIQQWHDPTAAALALPAKTVIPDM